MAKRGSQSWPVDYATSVVPEAYRCGACGTVGCKLWREYNTFLDSQSLRCCDCAGKEEKKDVRTIDDDGRIKEESFGRCDQIGSRIPAVPTEEGDTFWGYSSVPNAGARWWKCLPTRATDKARVLPPAAPEPQKPDYSGRWEEWQRDTVYVIEATSCEGLHLWSEWHKPGPREIKRTGPDAPANAPWEQMNPGCIITVGHLTKMPVCVGLSWARIHGQLVLFWDATSQVVDYRMIEKWLSDNVPAYKRGDYTNAMNFHNCVHKLVRNCEQRCAAEA
jgi:hypothetical protein